MVFVSNCVPPNHNSGSKVLSKSYKLDFCVPPTDCHVPLVVNVPLVVHVPQAGNP